MPVDPDLKNLPIEEAAEQAQALIDNGGTVFFKYTCAGCGERKMFDVPNVVYRTAVCEDCGHLTNLEESGVGYMLVI